MTRTQTLLLEIITSQIMATIVSLSIETVAYLTAARQICYRTGWVTINCDRSVTLKTAYCASPIIPGYQKAIPGNPRLEYHRSDQGGHWAYVSYGVVVPFAVSESNQRYLDEIDRLEDWTTSHGLHYEDGVFASGPSDLKIVIGSTHRPESERPDQPSREIWCTIS